MNIEKRYGIAKCFLVVLSIMDFVLLYGIGTYMSREKDEARQAKIVRGTYISDDTFSSIALDDEKGMYYLSGKEVSSGKVERVSEQVFKLVSGKFKDGFIIKDSSGDILLIDNKQNVARVLRKNSYEITIGAE